MSDEPTQLDQLPWEQLADETDKAYSAFLLYRDIPRHQRTVSAAWRIYAPAKKGKKQPKNPHGYFALWSRQNKWRERAKAWDDTRLEEELALVDSHRKEVLAAGWRGLSDGIQRQIEDLAYLLPTDRIPVINSIRETLKYLDSLGPGEKKGAQKVQYDEPDHWKGEDFPEGGSDE